MPQLRAKKPKAMCCTFPGPHDRQAARVWWHVAGITFVLMLHAAQVGASLAKKSVLSEEHWIGGWPVSPRAMQHDEEPEQCQGVAKARSKACNTAAPDRQDGLREGKTTESSRRSKMPCSEDLQCLSPKPAGHADVRSPRSHHRDGAAKRFFCEERLVLVKSAGSESAILHGREDFTE